MSDLYTVTVEELKAYVKVGSNSQGDIEAKLANLELGLDGAIQLVDRFLGTRIEDVPESIYRTAVLQAGQELYNRHEKANNGGKQMVANGEFIPARPTQDPLLSVYAMLRPFVGWF